MNALETVNQAEIKMSSKMGNSLFKLGRYNRVFQEIWAQIPVWAPMLKQWAVGSSFLTKILQQSSQWHTKVHFFHKNKWEKWWSRRLTMTNAFILCNLLWKVQKRLAANKESSFSCGICHSWMILKIRYSSTYKSLASLMYVCVLCWNWYFVLLDMKIYTWAIVWRL